MEKYFAGIDVGSVSTKAVIISSNKDIIGNAVISTGYSVAKAADEVMALALKQAFLNMNSINHIIATGYGRNLVPFANEQITEITCHAKGAYEILGSALTLIDIGGQDSKVIAISDYGKVDKFLMNDKCSAGTGRFLEVMARVLETDLDSMSKMALTASKRAKINNMCTVFAESEVISLIARGTDRDEIAGGLCWSIAERVGSMAKKVGIANTVFISGGVAYNEAIISTLGKFLDMQVKRLENPQINGAYGAALIAYRNSIKSNKIKSA